MLLIVAGTFGWMARDQAVQRRRTAEAVATLLDQCEDALRADQVEQAELAIEAAELRATDGGADELADRLAHCQADLKLLRELNAIGTICWTWDGAEDTLPDFEFIAAHCGAALAEYGVTPYEGR